MRVSVQFPLHTKSENVNRRFGNPFARNHSTARERQTVRLFLDSQLPKFRTRLASGPNFFRVTLVRISAGVLDDDAVHGALKGVRDEVAAWFGIKDGPSDPASWRVGQQKCPPKFYAVRVEIEDDDPDTRETIRVCGPLIPHLGPVIGDCSHCGRPAASIEHSVLASLQRRAARRAAGDREEQTSLVFRRAFYVLPEEQGGEDAVLRELDGIGDNAPAKLTVRRKGERLVLERRLSKDFPELGECWIYEVQASSPSAVATKGKGATG